MSHSQFAITRSDGRSNQQVVIDAVSNGSPGTIYSYEDLAGLLAVGTDRQFHQRQVQGIVRQALRRLLSEHDRTLVTMVGVGYKVAAANEHMGLSLVRRRKADRQLDSGLHVLRHVRWNELDDNTRQAHMGTLMVMEAVYQNQQALERRQAKVEDVVAQLKARLDGLSAAP